MGDALYSVCTGVAGQRHSYAHPPSRMSRWRGPLSGPGWERIAPHGGEGGPENAGEARGEGDLPIPSTHARHHA